MSTHTDELTSMVRSVFADHPAEVADGLPEALWATLTELGLVQLSLPEQAGGSGGTLADSAALLLVAGEAAAPVPLAETELAGWLLHAAGLPVPAGVLAVASGDLTVRSQPGGGVAVSGRLARVGWARHAARVAVLAGDLVLSVDPRAPGVELVEGANLAGEPRDELRLDVTVAAEDLAPAPDGAGELLARRAALARALLLAGAAQRALAGSVRYAGERIQFGRPIAKFQAVQQQLALAAGEVAAARAAAEAAAGIADGGFGTDDAELAIAVAKARTSEAAGAVARIAHQVHGAIGFTLEHDLRLATTRLWAWREEDGSDAHWNAVVGRRTLDAGADGLWPMLTRA
ncbi:acyl-CoA dehydrogenase family protein [Pseudonocardia acaciae]|uniref:acyl-CoA dehydrogenase family protein n=1 Tax=Pseudonocardia acaciae TaxID=551276 RepID=UPI000491ED08|nr:acyl-CoA dehydrogenase family protein [Pseudonocardia acaciae]